jgi:hypothetical protein
MTRPLALSSGHRTDKILFHSASGAFPSVRTISSDGDGSREEFDVNSRVLGLLPVLGLVGVLAAGCADMPVGPEAAPPPPPPPPVESSEIVIHTPFRAEDFAWSTVPGTARIHGVTAPGRTCAGRLVALTPDTPYSRERIRKLYGSAEAAMIPSEVVRGKVIANDNPAMRPLVRSVRCDASGGFTFDNLPAGPFFLISEVTDPAGLRVLMRHVDAMAGHTLQLNLALPPRPLVKRQP